MKNLRNILVATFVVALALVIHSCTSSDEYLKFTEGGAVSYTGKVDSLKIRSGRNRVKFEGLIISDPKVTEMRVYWNSKKDSLVVPISRTSGVDVISFFMENFPENIYNFEVRTFDAVGNRSISQNISTETFGERYQASLTDRRIVNSSLTSDFSLVIDFALMDLTTGAFATEIVYTDGSNVERTFTVPVDKKQAVMPNYKIGSQFKQRTLFLPNKTGADVFYTDFVLKEPQVIDLSHLIKNNTRPFKASSSSGRWGILADWTTNDTCKNQSGGYGGVDFGCCGNPPQTINLESGWGAADIINGKVYQTVTLEPGNYIFKANMLANGSVINGSWTTSDYAYITATTGAILANSQAGALESNAATLGFKRLLRTMSPDSAEFSFVITQTQQVSLGLAVTHGQERGGHVLSFRLYKK